MGLGFVIFPGCRYWSWSCCSKLARYTACYRVEFLALVLEYSFLYFGSLSYVLSFVFFAFHQGAWLSVEFGFFSVLRRLSGRT